MKEKVIWGLKLLAIILAVICVAAVIWYFWQKKVLENKSMDFLKQYNILAYPEGIYDKEKTEVSEEELREWNEKVNKQMGKFMNPKSKLYKRIYEEMKEIFLDEVKMKPEERIKTSEERILKKYSCHITSDTARMDFLVEETKTQYDGKKIRWKQSIFLFMLRRAINGFYLI